MYSTRILVGALFVLAACNQQANVGMLSDGGLDGGTDLPENSACTCIDLAAPCCADGLYCHAPVLCNITTSTGCYTEGRCEPKLAYGEDCSDPRECANDDATCNDVSGCTPPPLGEERCDVDLDCSPGRVCANSYCLLRNGEECDANSDCASNRCYGSTRYTCT